MSDQMSPQPEQGANNNFMPDGRPVAPVGGQPVDPQPQAPAAQENALPPEARGSKALATLQAMRAAGFQPSYLPSGSVAVNPASTTKVERPLQHQTFVQLQSSKWLQKMATEARDTGANSAEFLMMLINLIIRMMRAMVAMLGGYVPANHSKEQNSLIEAANKEAAAKGEIEKATKDKSMQSVTVVGPNEDGFFALRGYDPESVDKAQKKLTSIATEVDELVSRYVNYINQPYDETEEAEEERAFLLEEFVNYLFDELSNKLKECQNLRQVIKEDIANVTNKIAAETGMPVHQVQNAIIQMNNGNFENAAFSKFSEEDKEQLKLLFDREKGLSAIEKNKSELLGSIVYSLHSMLNPDGKQKLEAMVKRYGFEAEMTLAEKEELANNAAKVTVPTAVATQVQQQQEEKRQAPVISDGEPRSMRLGARATQPQSEMPPNDYETLTAENDEAYHQSQRYERPRG